MVISNYSHQFCVPFLLIMCQAFLIFCSNVACKYKLIYSVLLLANSHTQIFSQVLLEKFHLLLFPEFWSWPTTGSMPFQAIRALANESSISIKDIKAIETLSSIHSLQFQNHWYLHSHLLIHYQCVLVLIKLKRWELLNVRVRTKMFCQT